MENKINQIVKNFQTNQVKNLYSNVYNGKIWVYGNLEQILEIKPQIDKLTKTKLSENNHLMCEF